jgi:Mrp family chromosome partitioning ATPase/capsular polysaccharide biosynthesis protein
MGGTRSLFVSRWRWIALVAAVVTAVSALISWSRTPTYVSSADVQVRPQVVVPGTTPLEPDMGTELAVAQSAAVRELAATSLGTIPTELTGLSVSVPLNTHVLHVSVTANDPVLASRDAQAFAQAYVDFSRAQAPTGAGPRAARNGFLAPVIITPATAPSAPASPHHVVDVGIGLIIGLVLGLAAAWVRDRFDDRLRGVGDLEAQSGWPVLATIPRVRAAGRDGAAGLVVLSNPQSRAAAAYRDLRRVMARVAARQGAKTMLVTAAREDAAPAVSANLAVSLTEAYPRVLLVCANSQATHIAALSCSADGPGLADVLEGRSTVAEATRESVVPGLSVMPFGLAVEQTPAGEEALRAVFEEVRGHADFVVVDGPGLSSVDLAPLSELAEIGLFVVDARRTTRAQARGAHTRLNPFDDRFVGCVLDGDGGRAERLEDDRDTAASAASPRHTPSSVGAPEDEHE